jgi:hypothetical protein
MEIFLDTLKINKLHKANIKALRPKGLPMRASFKTPAKTDSRRAHLKSHSRLRKAAITKRISGLTLNTLTEFKTVACNIAAIIIIGRKINLFTFIC